MTRDEEAAANRAAMPETARIVDEFRSAFGPDVRVLFAEEGGRTVGTRASAERYMNADEWAHYLETGERPARNPECLGEWPEIKPCG